MPGRHRWPVNATDDGRVGVGVGVASGEPAAADAFISAAGAHLSGALARRGHQYGAYDGNARGNARLFSLRITIIEVGGGGQAGRAMPGGG